LGKFLLIGRIFGLLGDLWLIGRFMAYWAIYGLLGDCWLIGRLLAYLAIVCFLGDLLTYLGISLLFVRFVNLFGRNFALLGDRLLRALLMKITELAEILAQHCIN
jgi:hypothetical protein